MRYSRYAADPRWITARFAGTDAKGREFKAGERVFYYPSGKRIYSGNNAADAERDFLSARGDEEGMAYAS